jgi:hypothetical protein
MKELGASSAHFNRMTNLIIAVSGIGLIVTVLLWVIYGA